MPAKAIFTHKLALIGFYLTTFFMEPKVSGVGVQVSARSRASSLIVKETLKKRISNIE
jgi:hypothetical protein